MTAVAAEAGGPVLRVAGRFNYCLGRFFFFFREEGLERNSRKSTTCIQDRATQKRDYRLPSTAESKVVFNMRTANRDPSTVSPPKTSAYEKTLRKVEKPSIRTCRTFLCSTGVEDGVVRVIRRNSRAIPHVLPSLQGGGRVAGGRSLIDQC